MRVAAADALKAAVRKPDPEYNPIARQMRVAGEVEVEIRIGDTGDVDDVKVMSGNAMLSPSVVKAVKGWKFKPFEQGGKPATAVTMMKFNFKL